MEAELEREGPNSVRADGAREESYTDSSCRSCRNSIQPGQDFASETPKTPMENRKRVVIKEEEPSDHYQ